MDSTNSLKLKNDINILRNELNNLLESGEVDLDLTLELSMKLDSFINDFNNSLNFY